MIKVWGLADHYHSVIQLPLFLSSTIIASPNPVMSELFMYMDIDGMFIGICLEGFLYGKIFVPDLNCIRFQ